MNGLDIHSYPLSYFCNLIVEDKNTMILTIGE